MSNAMMSVSGGAAKLRGGKVAKRATVAKAARADSNNEVRHRLFSRAFSVTIVNFLLSIPTPFRSQSHPIPPAPRHHRHVSITTSPTNRISHVHAHRRDASRARRITPLISPLSPRARHPACEQSRYGACWPGRAEVPSDVTLLGNGNVKKISLLGSTGSIGTQTLDIAEEHPDKFEIVALSAVSRPVARHERGGAARTPPAVASSPSSSSNSNNIDSPYMLYLLFSSYLCNHRLAPPGEVESERANKGGGEHCLLDLCLIRRDGLERRCPSIAECSPSLDSTSLEVCKTLLS